MGVGSVVSAGINGVRKRIVVRRLQVSDVCLKLFSAAEDERAKWSFVALTSEIEGRRGGESGW